MDCSIPSKEGVLQMVEESTASDVAVEIQQVSCVNCGNVGNAASSHGCES